MRRARITLKICGALCVLGFSGPAHAHPSYAMFDMTVEQVLTGTVERFDYTIPHSWLHLTVELEDGEKKAWALEMDGVPDLYRQGIKGDFVAQGDVVMVKINPMRGDRPGGLWRGSVDIGGNAFGDTEGLVAPKAD